ncbi:MAG: hypothetical protein Q8L35_05545 [Actinomycetota bacterium]|nr:hypothetical protein [Actinomycetota bacterium]
MKTGVFITSRLGSTRLEQKALLEIAGKTVTELLIERVKQAALPDILVLCTSEKPENQRLLQMAKRNGILGFAGADEDVLMRYLQAADHFEVDLIINVDGDDLLFDYRLIDEFITIFQNREPDYIKGEGFPFGFTPTGVRTTALAEVCRIKDETDTAGWGKYFVQTGRFQVEAVEAAGIFHRPDIRMSLDYDEDRCFFEAVFNQLYQAGRPIEPEELMKFLGDHPEVVAINQGVHKRWQRDFEPHLALKVKDVN